MRNLPVHWAEGTFLRPQHFQAAERYWTELIGTSERWDHEYYYGLKSIDISSDAIANRQFQVTNCHARLKDGTLICLELGQDPNRLDLQSELGTKRAASADLSQAFAKDTTVRVCLAVPKVRLGRANVARETVGGGEHRFAATLLSVPDESCGGNDQDVEFRSLNVRLIPAGEESPGYEVLPIAQVRRSSDEKSVPRLDDDYIPPVLSIDAWPPLGIDIVRSIFDIIGQKISVLAEQVDNRGITFSSQSPGDRERVYMLSVLNEAFSKLSVMTFARGVHPFHAYLELCRVVGQLSILGPKRRAPEIPPYDHDNLAYIFKWVKRQIIELISAVRDYEYEWRLFEGAGAGMHVVLDVKWLGDEWTWYVGVHYDHITEAECRKLLIEGQLDWCMGSARQVDKLFREKIEGVTMRPMEAPPRALQGQINWIFYRVERGNPAWDDVVKERALAMRFQKQLVQNLAQLQGQHELVLKYLGKQAVLRIALFAVPKSEA